MGRVAVIRMRRAVSKGDVFSFDKRLFFYGFANEHHIVCKYTTDGEDLVRSPNASIGIY
jgi:hypothetical protein